MIGWIVAIGETRIISRVEGDGGFHLAWSMWRPPLANGTEPDVLGRKRHYWNEEEFEPSLLSCSDDRGIVATRTDMSDLLWTIRLNIGLTAH